MQRGAIALAVSALSVVLGVGSVAVAREEPGYWFGGDSTLGAVGLLGAGWALVACGLASWWRRPESRFGPLLVAGGFAWFVPELNNPWVGSSLAFTAGVALAAATPAFVGHAVLSYPGGHLAKPVERAAVALAYVGAILVLGVLPAFLDDPRAEGCNWCPDNLVLIADRATAADELRQVGVYLGLAWASLLAGLAVCDSFEPLRRRAPCSRPAPSTWR